MLRYKILLPIIALVCSLLAKEFTTFLMLADSITITMHPIEKETGGENENEKQQENDTSKLFHSHPMALYKLLSCTGLITHNERKNRSPFFKIISPPPEQA